MRFALLITLALVGVATAFGFGFEAIKQTIKVARPIEGQAPPSCCLPSKQFSFTQFEVTATWDVHGDNAGYSVSNFQVDQTNHLMYALVERINPTPKLTATEIWLTPGAIQGQWFEFFKFHGVPDCFVRNTTTQPDIFEPVCYNGDKYAYQGDVNVGTHPSAVWQQTGAVYNKTHIIQTDACMPMIQLGLGLNEANDWQERISNVLNGVLHVLDPAKFIPPTQCHPLTIATAAPYIHAANALRANF